MHKVQQIEPIGHFQAKPTEVLALLDIGPVILAQRSKPAAVLVSVAQWDSLLDQLEDLQARRTAEMSAGRPLTEQEWVVVKQGRAIAARGGPTITHEELKTRVEERYGSVAHPL